MSSNNNQDLALLVSNLQASVNNIISVFSNVQSFLSYLNQYDSSFNNSLNKVDIKDGNQDGEISAIQQLDINEINRIPNLEAKFAISNNSILVETISKNKIESLTKKRYYILKEYPIDCPICNKNLNLSLITIHINFSKKFKMMQNILYPDSDKLFDKKRYLKNHLTLLRFKIKNNIEI